MLHGQQLQKSYQTRRLQPAHVAASPEAAEAAAAAEALSACGAQQGSQQHYGASNGGGVEAHEPATPTPTPTQQQQQQRHASSSKGEEHQQHTGSIVAATQQAVAAQLAPQQESGATRLPGGKCPILP